jgi:hypothetical protein
LRALYILVSVVDYNSRALQENFFCLHFYTGYALALKTRWLQLFILPWGFLLDHKFKPKKKTTHRTLSQTAAVTLMPSDNSFAFHSVWESASICTFSYGGRLGSYTLFYLRPSCA